MRANFKEIYEKNRVALNEYKWWRHETFPDYENLSIKAEIYHGDKEYFFRIGEKTSKTINMGVTRSSASGHAGACPSRSF